MEQSSGRSPVQGIPGAATQGSMPGSADYWNSLDSMYTDQQLQPQGPPQPGSALQQQTPMGIDWNHPVFQQHQQQQPQQPPQQRSQLAHQADINHGIYSTIPQSWHANPLQQSAQGYPAPSQYLAHHQASPFQQGQPFGSRSITPSESSAFPPYPYQPNHFQPQQVQTQGPFLGHTSQQNQESASFAPAGPQTAMSRFSVRTEYFPESLHNNTIDLTDDPAHPQNGTSSEQTINPQFLGPTHSNVQQQTLQPNLLYGPPPELPAADGRSFNYFENAFSTRPQMGATRSATGSPADVSTITGLPQPQVVIPIQKSVISKKASQPKKTGVKGQKQTKGGTESDNSDGSGLEIEAPDEASPLPPTRPKEPIAAAEYDTIQAVWSPRNKWPSADKIKGALVAFKDVIKELRDSWKDQVQAMKAAENQGDNDKAAKLKEQVALQRRTLDRMVLATLNLGHPTIVEKLGEHPMALSIFYSFLADRFQAADFEGSLTINILKLLARFVTVDEELLQKTNIAKLLPKFVKKSGQIVKDLAKIIQDNASASTKRKQSNGKSGKEDSLTKSNSPSAEVIGSNRPRGGDSNVPLPTKKMVVTSNPKDVSKSSTQNGKAASAAAARPKPNIVAPKPTSLFGALSSASKRPGTTNAERAAAAAASKSGAPAEKKENPAVPPQKPAFSFGDIMADLNKPKETVVVEPAENKPPETEEERAKRLRKESRRRLRVSWKPDDALTEVRLFTHDPDEEIHNPGDGSWQGVGDVKGEGNVLKQPKPAEAEDLEDDDEGGIREDNFRDYGGLTEVVIEDQKGVNFIKRGGNQQPVSPEKVAQEHRESTTLMPFYTSPADVPVSPKEPPAPDPDETVPDVVPFGEMPDHIKAREERYFAYISPTSTAPESTATAAAASQPDASGAVDISNLLKTIQNGQTQQQVTPSLQPPTQVSTSDLERTINMFRQQSQPPAQQLTQAQVAQPALPAAVGGGIDYSQLLNIMTQLRNSASSQPQQLQPGMAANLGAIYSQMAGQNLKPGSQQGYDDYGDHERKRTREDRVPAEEFVRSKRTKTNDPKPYKYQLVACRFWAEGRCRKGDNCTFRHDTT